MYPFPRHTLLDQIIAEAERDPRIVGVIDYGSRSEGRADAWSDLDLALFVRDADVRAFEADWQQWAAQFGRLLLAYVGGVGHPWVRLRQLNGNPLGASSILSVPTFEVVRGAAHTVY